MLKQQNISLKNNFFSNYINSLKPAQKGAIMILNDGFEDILTINVQKETLINMVDTINYKEKEYKLTSSQEEKIIQKAVENAFDYHNDYWDVVAEQK